MTLAQLILNYTSDPRKDLHEPISEALWDEVLASLNNLNRSRCPFSPRFFILTYDNPKARQNNKIPDHVEWMGIKKDFADALEKLFLKLFENIKEGKNTDAFLKGGEDARKWIRSTLSYVLNNKVFYSETTLYQSIKKKVRVSLSISIERSGTESIDSFLDKFEKITGCLVQQELLRKFSKQDLERWLNHCRNIINLDSENDFSDQDEAHAYRVQKAIIGEAAAFLFSSRRAKFISGDEPTESGPDRFEKLEAENYQTDRTKFYSDLAEKHFGFQKDVFFWLPGQSINGLRASEISDKNPVYLGFFYSWLKQSSHYTASDIANILNVSASAISRDWKPGDIFAKAFATGNFYAEDGIYPVAFTQASRAALGLFDRKIRCFKKKDYDGASYKEVFDRKKIIWSIYEVMRSADIVDQIESAFVNAHYAEISKDGHAIKFKLISNEELGILTKQRYTILKVVGI